MASLQLQDLSDKTSLADLRKFIDDHKLNVAKNTGTSSRRTKADILADIRNAMKSSPVNSPNTTPETKVIKRESSPDKKIEHDDSDETSEGCLQIMKNLTV